MCIYAQKCLTMSLSPFPTRYFLCYNTQINKPRQRQDGRKTVLQSFSVLQKKKSALNFIFSGRATATQTPHTNPSALTDTASTHKNRGPNFKQSCISNYQLTP